jgi:copper oxidase (laccase) domain-containing protein
MAEVFGTNPADVVAGIGPSIGPCCYEVGAEVIDGWLATGVAGAAQAVEDRQSSYHFDLWSANRLALLGAGVSSEQIEVSGICVRCEVERFFSYRASKQGVASPGRMMLVAQLAKRS